VKLLQALVFVALAVAAAGTAQAENASVAVLVKASSSSTTVASFGRDAQLEAPPLRALSEAISGAGFALASVSGIVPALGDAPAGLPLDDAAAADLARKTGASAAVVVGIRATQAGRVRGTALRGAKSVASMRLIDVASGALIAESSVEAGGYAESDAAAEDSSMLAAVLRLRSGLVRQLLKQWPLRLGSSAAVNVGVTGFAQLSALGAVVQRLAATSSVSSVHIIALRADSAILSVEAAGGAAALVASLRRTSLPQGSFKVTKSGRGVEVELERAAPNLGH
jgi:hypothetical protein